MLVEKLKNAEEWEDFLRGIAGVTFYHSMKWRDAIARSSAATETYLTIRNENGILVGVFPAMTVTADHTRILDSLPHSDLGGPIIERKYVRQALPSLRHFIEEYSREKGISYVKICFSKDGSERIFKTQTCYVNDNKGIVTSDLEINPPDLIWERIFRKVQRKKIRRFERDGYQVRRASTRSDLRTFMTLYEQNMKHIGALPRPPKFFETIWDLLYPEHFSILLVDKKETVGGLAFFKHGKAICLSYLGLNREQFSPRYSCASFLYWEAVKLAHENGFRYVCFGSTPAHPREANERTNYSQKMVFGGSFMQQEAISVPFSPLALATILLGSRTIGAWKIIRNALPSQLQKTVESKIGAMF